MSFCPNGLSHAVFKQAILANAERILPGHNARVEEA
jgi:hypothetical protein